MKDVMRDELGAPKIVDRSIFQAELDALRIRAKAHIREGTGWPQGDIMDTLRTNGRPAAQWFRLKAGHSDDLGIGRRWRFPVGRNEHFSIIFAMRVHVLALDDVFDLAVPCSRPHPRWRNHRDAFMNGEWANEGLSQQRGSTNEELRECQF